MDDPCCMWSMECGFRLDRFLCLCQMLDPKVGLQTYLSSNPALVIVDSLNRARFAFSHYTTGSTLGCYRRHVMAMIFCWDSLDLHRQNRARIHHSICAFVRWFLWWTANDCWCFDLIFVQQSMIVWIAYASEFQELTVGRSNSECYVERVELLPAEMRQTNTNSIMRMLQSTLGRTNFDIAQTLPSHLSHLTCGHL